LSLLGGVADGYAISRRRVEKVLPGFGLELIECVGRPFDPELMEVVEAVGGTGRTSGTVVEVVRQGYRLNGSVFRFAQVKVTR
jgi:molecular chaperone GrpE